MNALESAWTAYRSGSYWRHGFSLRKLGSAVLSAFGVQWLAVEVITFFTALQADSLRRTWPLFLVGGLTWALWVNRPRHSVVCRLDGRDVSIEIRVDDLFACRGSLVVGSNTTFETDTGSGLIARQSVQGRFTERYFGHLGDLDRALEASLEGQPHQPLDRVQRKNREYPVGTVAQVRFEGRTAYFIAIARLSDHGVATGTFEDIKTSLPCLWEHVTSRGDNKPLAMPVIGSGFSRLSQTREEIVREILRSFVAACASSRPTERLSIVISPEDFYGHDIRLSELEQFLQMACKYPEFRDPNSAGRGRAVD